MIWLSAALTGQFKSELNFLNFFAVWKNFDFVFNAET